MGFVLSSSAQPLWSASSVSTAALARARAHAAGYSRLGGVNVRSASVGSARVHNLCAPHRRCVGLSAVSMSASTDSNALLDTSAVLPLYGKVLPEHVEPAVEQMLQWAEQQVAELEASLDKATPAAVASFETLVHPLEKVSDKLGKVWGTVSHLSGVKDTEALREAKQKMQPKIVAFTSRISQSEPIYKGFKALQSSKEAYDALSDTQKRIVDQNVLSAELGGVALQGDQKKRFNEIKLRLAELSTTFGNNVLDSTKAYVLILDKQEQIEGMPSSWRAMAAQTAASKGHEGATPESGPWAVTLDFPSYMPFMQYAKSRELREQVYKASLTRASELAEYVERDVNNVPVCEEILALRKEMAGILGFAHYAEVSLARKTATFEEATALMEQLRGAAYAAAQQELVELQAFAESMGFPAGESLQHWDVTFYSERLKESKFDFEEEQLRPYFSLENVLDGLFGLVKRLFGVTVVPVDKEAESISVWDEHVRFYCIQNESGEPMAYFYLDPYSRPAEKRGGAWMDEVVSRSTLFAPAGRTARLPVGHAVCNQSPPVGSKPSTMTFREVETLFHEFGHLLNHTLTVEDGMVAGIRGVEWDLVELPSQYMENWCYHRDTLMGMAKHVESGEPLPEEFFEKIVAAKKFRAASMLLRQLHFSIVDLELHSLFPADGSVNMLEWEKRVGERTLVMPPQPYDRFLCTFGHIFAGGYSAGYYSYKYAEVYSADAFAAFEEVGLENEERVRELGTRLRNTVFAMGGSRPAKSIYRMFRGREASIDALLRHAGLSSPA
ncbi:putative cytosolic oligopeptidase A [Porphyridium purpureum]|uniref:oligopeptidase A n=1 Tax=Porphyridium purpureum TaxID=35688 RepID=A0A5J4YTP1_PORPP|nr:putative cytosolic oligopeptidase A [Porphyridium purpureum]|eukprot:POR9630..scf227_4